MAARIEMIGMSVGFAFRSLFATVTGENVLVVIVVEVLVLVDVVVIGHSFCFCCIAQRDFEKCLVAVIKETGKNQPFSAPIVSSLRSIRY